MTTSHPVDDSAATRGGLVATPDDGRRSSQEPVWDESDRPESGWVPSSDPPSARGLSAARSLLQVHGELRTLLARIRELVDEVVATRLPPADARSMLARMASREQRWTVGADCAAYCRLVAQHHYGEDVEIFPALRTQPGLGAVLDRLQVEHEVIHEILDRIDAVLIRMIAGTAAPEALSAETDRLSDALLSHLSYEERQLLRPMAEAFG